MSNSSQPADYSSVLDLAAPIRSWTATTLYHPPTAGQPFLLVGRLPEAIRPSPMVQCWICETGQELARVQDRLARPIPQTSTGAWDFRAGPDGALGKSRTFDRAGGKAGILLYGPPEPGWPWLVLMSFPRPVPDLVRSRYAWRSFRTRAKAVGEMSRMRTECALRGLPFWSSDASSSDQGGTPVTSS